MPYFEIYAGLNGSFGNAKYQYTDEFEDQHEADLAAYMEACSIFENHESKLIDYKAIEKEALKDFEDYDPNDEDCQEELQNIIDEIIEETRESWVSHWAKKLDETSNDNLL